MQFDDLFFVEATRSEEAEAYRLTYLTLHNLEVRSYTQWSSLVRVVC